MENKFVWGGITRLEKKVEAKIWVFLMIINVNFSSYDSPTHSLGRFSALDPEGDW